MLNVFITIWVLESYSSSLIFFFHQIFFLAVFFSNGRRLLLKICVKTPHTRCRVYILWFVCAQGVCCLSKVLLLLRCVWRSLSDVLWPPTATPQKWNEMAVSTSMPKNHLHNLVSTRKEPLIFRLGAALARMPSLPCVDVFVIAIDLGMIYYLVADFHVIEP